MARPKTRIGIVDLDTSHPPAWTPILREMGCELVGVHDGQSVHPAGFAERFAAEHGIGRVFSSLGELANAVDVGIIHGCDWDTHRAKAAVFVERGKAVFVDKPLAGNPGDLWQLVHWAEADARIIGGSALRWCDEARAFLARPEAERGVPQTVLVTCGFDEFNYGIHAYSLLLALMGPGAARVQHMSDDGQLRVRVEWPDGRCGLIVIADAQQHLPITATVATERAVTHLPIDTGGLYRAVLNATLPYLAGETSRPPIPMRELIEPELCAIAAKQSAVEASRPVHLGELDANAAGYDGAAFAEFYRRLKYPAQAETPVG